MSKDKKLEFFTEDNRTLEIITKSPQETKAIAKVFARLLVPSDIICLDGDLGAGKTFFTSNIAKELDISKVVPSPTFTILIEHRDGKIPLFHFDAYRLENEDEFYDLGFGEYLYDNGICVVEWASRIKNVFPNTVIQIHMLRDNFEDSDTRKLIFSFPKSDNRFYDFEKGVNDLNDHPSK